MRPRGAKKRVESEEKRNGVNRDGDREVEHRKESSSTDRERERERERCSEDEKN